MSDAADELSHLIGEEVRERDLLRLALDHHLTLSVDLVNHASARCGQLVSLEKAKRYEYPVGPKDFPNLDLPEEGAVFTGLCGLAMGDGSVFEPAECVTSIEGIWDLAMVGAETLDVEHRYQRATGGPDVDLVVLDGAILCRPDATYCQVQEHFDNNEFAKRVERLKGERWDHPRNFYPAGSLPSDAVWIVRIEALHKAADRINGTAVPKDQIRDKPLERRERATLLTIIAGLAELAKVDLSKSSSAAIAIESATARLGARVAGRTIEEHLKRIPDALEARGR